MSKRVSTYERTKQENIAMKKLFHWLIFECAACPYVRTALVEGLQKAGIEKKEIENAN